MLNVSRLSCTRSVLFCLLATLAGPIAIAQSPALSKQLDRIDFSVNGIGQFNGSDRHIGGGNKPIREDEAQTHGRAPDEPLHSTTVTDGAYQGTGSTTDAASSGASFAGLDHTNWGAGWPPDPNGDVGPTTTSRR